MRHSIHRLPAFLVCTSLLLVGPPLAFSGSAEFDPLKRSTLVAQCADRLEKMFSLITVQTKELDLEHAKIILVGDQISIPLKKPHDHVKAVRWRPKDLTEGLDFLRLLQQGKIGAVSLLPFRHDPAAMYEMRENLLDELQGCQNKERVLEVLGQCAECTVREWLDLKP